MIDFIKTVHPFRLAPVSPDMDKFAEALVKYEPPDKIWKYKSGETNNGWIIPQSWGWSIGRDMDILFQNDHPLAVWGYSDSFYGSISHEKLESHILKSDNHLKYHWKMYYDIYHFPKWGFSLSSFLDVLLSKKQYFIDLQCEKKPGEMRVFEYCVPGSSNHTVVLHAHNCHAAQANDDMSGVVVGIEIIKELRRRKNLKYNYKLLIGPELFSSIWWLKDNPLRKDQEGYSIQLKSVGSYGSLKIQDSLLDYSLISEASKNNFIPEKIFKFRTLHGNDETIFESAGFPSVSLTRFPFEEYHTSSDTPDRINPHHLQNTVIHAFKIIDILERDRIIRLDLEYPGVPCFSTFQRYEDCPHPQLMNYLPTCDRWTILELANYLEIPFSSVYYWLKKLEEQNIVRLS